MKKLLVSFALLVSTVFAGPVANDLILSQQNGSGIGHKEVYILPGANTLFGFNGSLAPTPITLGTGLSFSSTTLSLTANVVSFGSLSNASGYLYNNGSGTFSYATPGGSGDVVGPASATDSHVALFDTTTGKKIKDGGAMPTALPPNGTASGDLAGTYPSPTVAAIHETSGPTKLTVGTIADGEFLKRSGSTVVSAAVAPSVQVSNMTAMRALTAGSLTNNQVVELLGFAKPGDGGGGPFYWADGASVVISSITSNGSTMTVNTATAHGFFPGLMVTIAGSVANTAPTGKYNGLWQVGTVSTNQFVVYAAVAADTSATPGAVAMTVADNAGTIIGLTGGGNGRLFRIEACTYGNAMGSDMKAIWFGGIPDSGTDIGPAVNAAWAAICASPSANRKGSIYISSGLNIVTTPIVLNGLGSAAPQGSLWGSGTGSSYLLAGTVSMTVVTISNMTAASIYGISFLGSVPCTYVNADTIPYFQFHDCDADTQYNPSFPYYADSVRINACTSLLVNNVRIANTYGSCMTVAGSGGMITGCNLSQGGVYSHGNSAPCIKLDYLTSVKIAGCNMGGGGPVKFMAISSMSSSGTAITVNATSHGFNVGDYVVIMASVAAGSPAAKYNGRWKIATVATNSFTIASTVSADTAATPGVVMSIICCIYVSGVGGSTNESSIIGTICGDGSNEGYRVPGACSILFDGRAGSGEIAKWQVADCLCDMGEIGIMALGRTDALTVREHTYTNVNCNSISHALFFSSCQDMMIDGGANWGASSAAPSWTATPVPVTYVPGQYETDPGDGNVYICRATVTSSTQPHLDATHWAAAPGIFGYQPTDNSAVYIEDQGGSLTTGISIEGFKCRLREGIWMNYAVQLDGAYIKNVTVDGCDLYGYTAPYIFTNSATPAASLSVGRNLFGTGATPKMRGTVGTLGPPSVPGSTVGLVNPYPYDCSVYVAGGVVTAIAVDGVTTGLTAGLVRVWCGSTITLTYSVAPTWVWVGE